MRRFINPFTTLVVISVVTLLFISSCKEESTEPKIEVSIDQELVGTWELTKILKPIVTTPEAQGLALTAIFNQDATMQFTTVIDADTTTTINTGTWSVADTVLTITFQDEEPKSSPYVISNSIVTISEYSIEFNGTPFLATLEFTKQP
ncbi:MAG: lipocalin family protein [Melioribacteraceae bacterium]